VPSAVYPGTVPQGLRDQAVEWQSPGDHQTTIAYDYEQQEPVNA
jgi:hypothetical protein